MIQKLTRRGNELILTIDPATSESLNLDENAEVELIVSGRSLIVTPVPVADDDDEEFEAALDHVMKTREKVLRKLAE